MTFRFASLALASFLLMAPCAQAIREAPPQARPAENATRSPNDPASDEDLTCSIAGIVLRGQDGAPLKNATVQLDNETDREHKIAGKTTADGHFELKNVPAAQYRLKVSRNGYVTQEMGQRKPGDPGAAFTLRPKQKMTDLTFKMARAAVIAGRIFDEDGEPMAAASVSAMRQAYRDGKKEYQMAAFARTDDLGEYRLYGLAPGRYFVAADVEHWNRVVGDRQYSNSSKTAAETGYEKTYYPSALDISKASSISVKEGDEIPSTDILLVETTVYRVSGRVVYPFAHKGKYDTQVNVMRRNQLEWDWLRGESVEKTDGTFEIPEVPPGAYTLNASFWDQDKVYSGEREIDVTTVDVDGVTLTLSAGVTMEGTVEWEGKPSIEGGVITISLAPVTKGALWGGQTHVEENGRFTFKGVPQGTFQMSIEGASKDCYVKEMKYGGNAVADQTMRVKSTADGAIEITMSSRGARIQGTVMNDESTPVAGVWVVAVPEESKRNLPFWFRSVTTDQYGHYDLRGLRSGKYKLFGWDGVERGEWEDAEFLKTTEGKGITMEVVDGDAKSRDLQLIQLKDRSANPD